MKIKRTIILAILIVFSAAAICAQKGETKEKLEKVNRLMERLTAEGFSGAVLVASDGRVSSNGYGYADREKKIKCTPHTIFSTGSITKPLTATAVLKLEMAGKLSVEDKLSRFFQDLPADKRDITIHQLLTHSAGLPDSLGRDYEPLEKEAFLRRAFAAPLIFKPGTEYEYSNVGFSILAAIIEKVSGQPYEEYLYKNVFLPAGMKNTGYSLPDWKDEDLAVGYLGDERWGKMTDQSHKKPEMYWNLLGNGGILSSVEDLYKFHLALKGETILSEGEKEKQYRPYIKEGPDADSFYGYGWSIVPTPRNTNLITHNGGNGIFFADFWRYPQEDLVVIVMTNSLKKEYRDLAREIALTMLLPDYNSTLTTKIDHAYDDLDQHPDGQMIKNFIKTVRSGDPKMIESLVEQNFADGLKNAAPIKDHIGGLTRVGKEIKDLEVGSITVKGSETAVNFKNSPLRLLLRIVNGKIQGIGISD
ncbi:MAG: serine hydrolase domain-containing protein [Pyrinomonadaceae bacterium]